MSLSKKTICTPALALILCALLPGVQLHARNYLGNPSFEESDEQNPSMVSVWDRLYSLDEYIPNFKWDHKLALDGKSSLKLEANQIIPDNQLLIWRHPKLDTVLNELPPGTEMELSVYVLADGAPTKCAFYYPYTSGLKEIGDVSVIAPGAWRKLKYRFKLEHQQLGNVYLRLYGPAGAWFDKAYLGPAQDTTDEPNIIPVHNAPVTYASVPNPGAETLSADTNLPVGWTPRPGSEQDACSVSSPGISGEHSFHLESRQKDGGPAWICQINGNPFGKDDKDDYLLQMQATTHSIAATNFIISATLILGNGQDITYSTPPTSIYQGIDKAFLKIKKPLETVTAIQIAISLNTEGQMTFDDVSIIPETEDNTKGLFYNMENEFVHVIGMPSRRSWTHSSQPRKLKIECQLPSDTLDIALVHIPDDSAVNSWSKNSLATGEKHLLELDMPVLQTGQYELQFNSGEGPASLHEYCYFRIIPDNSKPKIDFRDDHSMTIDGRPFFPNFLSRAPQTPEAFRIMSQSGLTAFNASAGNNASEWHYLNQTAKQFGLKLIWWNDFAYMGQYDTDRISYFMKEIHQAIKDADELLAFSDDESAWCGLPSEWMHKSTRHLYAAFPELLIWENHAPVMHGPASDFKRAFHQIRRFTSFSDVASVDIYPVPDGHSSYADLPSGNHSLSCVGEFADEVSRSSWHEKPTWMCLQNWGLSEAGGKPLNDTRPRPTYSELRFMAWNAITHGATGLEWHGEGNTSNYGGNDDYYSEYWQRFADVQKEITAVMQKYLELYGHDVQCESGTPHILIRARNSGKESVFIAVNEDGKASHSFTFPWDGKFYSTPSGKEIAKGTIALPPYGVFIATFPQICIDPTPRFSPQDTTSVVECPYRELLIDANWTAHPQFPRSNGKKSFYFRQDFTIPADAEKILLQFCGDDAWEWQVDDSQLKANGANHTSVYQYDLTAHLKPGKHHISGILHNINGTTGLVFAILSNGTPIAVSGSSTLFSLDGQTDWTPGMERGKPPAAPWGAPKLVIEHTFQ